MKRRTPRSVPIKFPRETKSKSKDDAPVIIQNGWPQPDENGLLPVRPERPPDDGFRTAYQYLCGVTYWAMRSSQWAGSRGVKDVTPPLDKKIAETLRARWPDDPYTRRWFAEHPMHAPPAPRLAIEANSANSAISAPGAVLGPRAGPGRMQPRAFTVPDALYADLVAAAVERRESVSALARRSFEIVLDLIKNSKGEV